MCSERATALPRRRRWRKQNVQDFSFKQAQTGDLFCTWTCLVFFYYLLEIMHVPKKLFTEKAVELVAIIC